MVVVAVALQIDESDGHSANKPPFSMIKGMDVCVARAVYEATQEVASSTTVGWRAQVTEIR